MKKIFVFAIAAATMAVGCQKIQDLVRPNTPADENELVEIKFNTNIAVVETKTVEDLEGLSLTVYGINDTDPTSSRQFKDGITATAGAAVEGKYALDLDGGPYYYDGNSDKYSFYGYFLDEAVLAEGAVTIDGANDILLAKASGNGTYCGSEARGGNNPELVFEHVLSQFKFAAINLGSEDISLTGITVKSSKVGTMTVGSASQAVAGGDDMVEFPVAMDPLALVSKSDVATPGEADYAKVVSSDTQSYLILFPALTSYELYFTVSQGGQTRTLKKDVAGGIAAGNAYEFRVKLYSLEEIEVTASLTPWTPAVIEIDTDDAVEVE